MSTIIRAAITSNEWVRLRQHALALDAPVSAIVGALIRDYLRDGAAEMERLHAAANPPDVPAANERPATPRTHKKGSS